MNVFLVIILILIVLEIIKIGVKVALGTMKFAFKFNVDRNGIYAVFDSCNMRRNAITRYLYAFHSNPADDAPPRLQKFSSNARFLP